MEKNDIFEILFKKLIQESHDRLQSYRTINMIVFNILK